MPCHLNITFLALYNYGVKAKTQQQKQSCDFAGKLGTVSSFKLFSSSIIQQKLELTMENMKQINSIINLITRIRS